jgi:hypothetical protein
VDPLDINLVRAAILTKPMAEGFIAHIKVATAKEEIY